jgi:hypothetical protein
MGMSFFSIFRTELSSVKKKVINKAGGLIYQRNFAGSSVLRHSNRTPVLSGLALIVIPADGLAQLTSNEYLVLAGTLHGIHAITSRLAPTGTSSGAHVIEAETFKMTVLLTPTGACSRLISYAPWIYF